MKRSIIIAIIVAVVVLVPATVYAASPLFVSSTIDETLPAAKTGKSSIAQDGPGIEGKMMIEKDKGAMVEDDSVPGESMRKEEAMVKDERWSRKEMQ